MKARKYNGNKSHDSYLTNHNCQFQITPTNPTEIQYIIKDLNAKKGTGPNSIPSFILRIIAPIISVPISNLCNRSLETGVYPDLLKIARVIPIHKKDSKLDVSNYRPISLLSNINKIFEKIMCLRIRNHFEKSNLLYDLQFGFREKHSTNHAVISMVQKIQEQIQGNKFAIGVFIDLQKAFDTINHDILMSKLNTYGIKGVANAWLKSYLSNRKQYVTINGHDSDKTEIIHGVPQGSVLGPLLFTIYINDMHKCIRNSTSFHFADDTNLLYIPQTKLRNRNIVRRLNIDIKSLDNWLTANKISLNSNKTELIVFRKKGTSIPNIKIKINGTKLIPTTCVKYLGIYLDEHLTFDSHISVLNAKLRRANNMLAISRHYVPLKNLKQIYYGQFHSHLQYCCQVWGQNTSKLTKTISLQKKAVRLMSFADRDAHSSPLFSKLEILKLNDIISNSNTIFVHSSLNGNAPHCFKKTFEEFVDNKRYETTRNPKSLCSIPTGSVKLACEKTKIMQQFAEIWNKMLKKLSSQNSPCDWMKTLTKKELKKILKGSFIADY